MSYYGNCIHNIYLGGCRTCFPIVIPLTEAEIQSGLTRVEWAEALIKQLPKEHEGRNSWLLNYGVEK